jgi:hypothetical protein
MVNTLNSTKQTPLPLTHLPQAWCHGCHFAVMAASLLPGGLRKP